MEDENNLTCTNCEFEVKDDFDFCPSCGALFIEDVKCTNHPETDAEGVCLICEATVCSECGGFVNNKFLCNEHSDYEVYESMARVYGSNDFLEVNYIKDILEGEGLHPFIYTRKNNPLHMGAPDYSLFRSAGDTNGRIVNEIKIMVPLSEVLTAEEIISNAEME